MDSSSGARSGGSDPTTTTPTAAAGSSSSAAAAAAITESDQQPAPAPARQPPPPSRYESQKRRDWNTFQQYLRNHKPPLTLARCSGAHVVEFLEYLDQFGKTKVHSSGCPYFGDPSPPALCACPLRQAWGSLDALIGRLRAAYDESGGQPEGNPFAARAVRTYLREVRESQAKARGIPFQKKKRKRSHPQPPDHDEGGGDGASGSGGGDGGTGASSSGGAVAAQ